MLLSNKIMRVSVAFFFTGIVMGGCFWKSSKHDFCADPLTEVSVIWERTIPCSNVVEVASWSTTNQVALTELQLLLKNSTWTSLSTLAVRHPTRLILVTRKGYVWECHLFGSEKDEVAMFNRNDVGQSGVISCGIEIVNRITTRIKAETGVIADLTLDLIHDEKCAALPRYWTESAQQFTRRFPYSGGTTGAKGHL